MTQADDKPGEGRATGKTMSSGVRTVTRLPSQLSGQNTSCNSNTPALMATATAVEQLSEVLQVLCSSKGRATFTPHQVETWCAVLAVYPPNVARLAVLQMALSPDPFPELGKVVARCQIEMAKRSDQVTQSAADKLSHSVLRRMAANLAIQIEGDE